MSLNVLQVSFFLDRERRAPERLLADWHSLGDIAEAVAGDGNRVTVIQASHTAGSIRRNGVEYFFLEPAAAGSLAQDAAFRARFAAAAPHVVHVHGLGFPRDVLALRELAPRSAILLQDHADRTPRPWRRGLWSRGVAAADGVSFCAHAQALEFRRRGLLEGIRVFEIPESTSQFSPGDRDAARALTGLDGDPGVLWVGHLDRNKDPLTVLDGVAAVLDELPGLKLWMCYGSAPLLEEVQARLAADERLARHVCLVGRVPHERVEAMMRAADLFVLGSHREGSSFSLIEALATGLLPVVTDIPSLRALTGEGRVGALWRRGDPGSLARGLRLAARRCGAAERRRIRRHFDDFLSRAALGRRFSAAYRELSNGALANRRMHAHT
jgi:glycosyltransferase involved in cell wall biosynthesis